MSKSLPELPDNVKDAAAVRLPALDALRTWAVLLMLIMHVFPTYARPEYYHSVWYRGFFYAIEGMAAPAFMFAMGVSIVWSKPKSTGKIWRKGLLLLAQGYLLNVLKFAPPVLIFNAFPASLFAAIGAQPGTPGLIRFFMVGDILQFAGIAYIICHILYRPGRSYKLFSLAALVGIIAVAPCLYTLDTGKIYLSSLFYGSSPLVFFPVLPWLAFPLLGMVSGSFIKTNTAGPDRNMKRLGGYGLLLFSAGLFLILISPATQWGIDYYRRGSGGLLLYSGVVLGTTATWHFLLPYLSASLHKLMLFCSTHVTLIYGIQWILIYWGIIGLGYQQFSLYGCALVLVVISLLTLSLTWLFTLPLFLFNKSVPKHSLAKP
jgi:uncharacterized membrane protein